VDSLNSQLSLLVVLSGLAKRRRLLLRLLISLSFFGLVEGNASAKAVVQKSPASSVGQGLPFAVADFDGDLRFALKPGPITPAQPIIAFSCSFRPAGAGLFGSSELRAASGLKRYMRVLTTPAISVTKSKPYWSLNPCARRSANPAGDESKKD
jgi:hypothetical protein